MKLIVVFLAITGTLGSTLSMPDLSPLSKVNEITVPVRRILNDEKSHIQKIPLKQKVSGSKTPSGIFVDERPLDINIEDSDIPQNHKVRIKRKNPSKAEIAKLRNMKDSFDDLRQLKDERPELPDIKADFQDLKKLKDERPGIQTNFDEIKNLKDERPVINTNFEELKQLKDEKLQLPNIGSDSYISSVPKSLYKRKAPSKAEIARLRNMKDSFDDLRNLKDERPELPDIRTDFEDLKKLKDERPGIQTNFDEIKNLKDERPVINTNFEELKQLKDKKLQLPNIGSDSYISSIPKSLYKRKAPSKAEIARLRNMKDSFDDLRNLKDERPELPDIRTDFEDLKKLKDERPGIQTNFDGLKNLKDERPVINTNFEELKQLKDQKLQLSNIGSDSYISSVPKSLYKRKAPSKAEIARLRNMKDSFDDLRNLKDERPELPDIRTDFEDLKKLKDERPGIQTNFDGLKNLKDERPVINTNFEELKQLKDKKPQLPNIGSDSYISSVPKSLYKRKAPSKAEIARLRNMKDSFDDLRNLKDERPELPDIRTDFEDLKKLKDERPGIQTNFDGLKNLKDERPVINTNFEELKQLKDEKLQLPNIGSDSYISSVPKSLYKRKAPSKAEIARLRNMKDSFDDLRNLKDERPVLPDIRTDFEDLKKLKDDRPQIHVDTDEISRIGKIRIERSTSNTPDLSPLSILREEKPKVPQINVDTDETTRVEKIRIERSASNKPDLSPLSILREEKPKVPEIIVDTDQTSRIKPIRIERSTSNTPDLSPLSILREEKPRVPQINVDTDETTRVEKIRIERSASNKPDLSPLSILREEKPKVPEIIVDTDQTSRIKPIRIERSTSNTPDLSPLSILREEKPRVPQINVDTDETTRVEKIRIERSDSNKPDLSPLSILREEKPRVPQINVDTDETTRVEKIRIERSASNKPDLSPLSILREEKPKVPQINVDTDETTRVEKIRIERSASNKPDLSPLSILREEKPKVPEIIVDTDQTSRIKPIRIERSTSNTPDLSPLSILREEKPRVPQINVDTDETTRVEKIRIERSASNKPDLSPLSILREEKPKVPQINVDTDETTRVEKIRIGRSDSNKPDLSPLSILREEKPRVPQINVDTDETTRVEKIRIEGSDSNKPDLSPLSILREEKPRVPQINVDTDETTRVEKIRIERSDSNKPDLSPLSILREEKPRVPQINVDTDETTRVEKIRIERSDSNKPDLSPLSILREEKSRVPQINIDTDETSRIEKIRIERSASNEPDLSPLTILKEKPRVPQINIDTDETSHVDNIRLDKEASTKPRAVAALKEKNTEVPNIKIDDNEISKIKKLSPKKRSYEQKELDDPTDKLNAILPEADADASEYGNYDEFIEKTAENEVPDRTGATEKANDSSKIDPLVKQAVEAKVLDTKQHEIDALEDSSVETTGRFTDVIVSSGKELSDKPPSVEDKVTRGSFNEPTADNPENRVSSDEDSVLVAEGAKQVDGANYYAEMKVSDKTAVTEKAVEVSKVDWSVEQTVKNNVLATKESQKDALEDSDAKAADKNTEIIGEKYPSVEEQITRDHINIPTADDSEYSVPSDKDTVLVAEGAKKIEEANSYAEIKVPDKTAITEKAGEVSKVDWPVEQTVKNNVLATKDGQKDALKDSDAKAADKNTEIIGEKYPSVEKQISRDYINKPTADDSEYSVPSDEDTVLVAEGAKKIEEANSYAEIKVPDKTAVTEKAVEVSKVDWPVEQTVKNNVLATKDGQKDALKDSDAKAADKNTEIIGEKYPSVEEQITRDHINIPTADESEYSEDDTVLVAEGAKKIEEANSYAEITVPDETAITEKAVEVSKVDWPVEQTVKNNVLATKESQKDALEDSDAKAADKNTEIIGEKYPSVEEQISRDYINKPTADDSEYSVPSDEDSVLVAEGAKKIEEANSYAEIKVPDKTAVTEKAVEVSKVDWPVEQTVKNNVLATKESQKNALEDSDAKAADKNTETIGEKYPSVEEQISRDYINKPTADDSEYSEDDTVLVAEGAKKIEEAHSYAEIKVPDKTAITEKAVEVSKVDWPVEQTVKNNVLAAKDGQKDALKDSDAKAADKNTEIIGEKYPSVEEQISRDHINKPTADDSEYSDDDTVLVAEGAKKIEEANSYAEIKVPDRTAITEKAVEVSKVDWSVEQTVKNNVLATKESQKDALKDSDAKAADKNNEIIGEKYPSVEEQITRDYINKATADDLGYRVPSDEDSVLVAKGAKKVGGFGTTVRSAKKPQGILKTVRTGRPRAITKWRNKLHPNAVTGKKMSKGTYVERTANKRNALRKGKFVRTSIEILFAIGPDGMFLGTLVPKPYNAQGHKSRVEPTKHESEKERSGTVLDQLIDMMGTIMMDFLGV